MELLEQTLVFWKKKKLPKIRGLMKIYLNMEQMDSLVLLEIKYTIFFLSCMLSTAATKDYVTKLLCFKNGKSFPVFSFCKTYWKHPLKQKETMSVKTLQSKMFSKFPMKTSEVLLQSSTLIQEHSVSLS